MIFANYGKGAICSDTKLLCSSMLQSILRTDIWPGVLKGELIYSSRTLCLCLVVGTPDVQKCECFSCIVLVHSANIRVWWWGPLMTEV